MADVIDRLVPNLLSHMGEIGRDVTIDMLSDPGMPNEQKEAVVVSWFRRGRVPYQKRYIDWFLNSLRLYQTEEDRVGRPLSLSFLDNYIYGRGRGQGTRLPQKPESLDEALAWSRVTRLSVVKDRAKRDELSDECRDDLEQVAAEAITRAWERFDPRRGAGFQTFADRVCRNAVSDYLARERLRQHESLGDGYGWSEDDPLCDLDERIAIDRLTAIPGMELVHYASYGYSDAKLSEWTGVSVGATRKRRQRAMRAMQAAVLH